MTQRFSDDPQSIPGARIIAKGIVRTYTAGTHKADVQLVGSHPTALTAIRVATDIPAADVVAGRQCTVLFLDPANQDDAVVLTIQGALPSGGGGGGTPSNTVVSETTFGLSPTAGVATPYSRGDHTHGSPTDPVTAHVAAADPHTVYGALAQAETWAQLQTFSLGLKLASGQQIIDSGGTGRILPATASPHVRLTGDTYMTGNLGVRSTPMSDTSIIIRAEPSFTDTIGSTTVLKLNPSVTATAGATFGVWALEGILSVRMQGGAGVDLYGLQYVVNPTSMGAGAQTCSVIAACTAGWATTRTAGTLAITDAFCFKAILPQLISGSAANTTITNAYGVLVEDQTAGGTTIIATNIYGVRVLPQTSPVNCYPFRDDGTAESGDTVANVFKTATQFFSTVVALGGGKGVMGIANAQQEPSSTPSGGGVFYAKAGSPKWRDSAGVKHNLAVIEAGLTLANGANDNVAVNDDATLLVITGPTAAFSLSGIASPRAGRRLLLYYAGPWVMTLVNDATSTAANRILTMTGGNRTTALACFIELVYSATAARWLVTSFEA